MTMIPDNEEVEVQEELELDPIQGMRESIKEVVEDDMPIPDLEPKQENVPVVEEVEPEVEAVAEVKPVEAEASAVDKEAINKEMDDLGIKSNRSRERFTAMSEQIATFAPIKEALETAGVKDVETVTRLVERAEAANSYETAIIETGATPEDFGKAMGVLGKLSSGSHEQANEAFDEMVQTLRNLAPILGRSLDFIDPLTPELREAVDMGEISEANAIELTKARMSQTLQQQKEVETNKHSEFEAIEKTARTSLTELGGHLEQHDPSYKQKYPILSGMVKTIMETLPPDKWVDATKLAYQNIPNIPAPSPPPPVRQANPIRPNVVRPATMIPEGVTPMEAMRLGIRNANGEI